MTATNTYRGRVLPVISEDICVPLAYITYNPQKKLYAEAASSGLRLFSFGVYIGDRGINECSGIRPFRHAACRPDGSFDFSELDNDIETATGSDFSRKVIPRVYLDSPSFWDEQHPAELCLDQFGKPHRESFCSAKWLAFAKDALTALIRHVEASSYAECIVGYQVAAGSTEEWMYHGVADGALPDYSAPALCAFRQWVENKYTALTALNSAWHTNFTSFADILPPSADERKPHTQFYPSNAVPDYHRFLSEAPARAIWELCRHIKQTAGDDKLTGAFYGYVAESIEPALGHFALSLLLECPYIDYLASPNSYMYYRDPSNDWPFMSAVASATLHGKLWFIESDTRTHLTTTLDVAMPDVCPPGAYYSDMPVWQPAKSAYDACQLLKRNFGKVYTAGIGTWWFDMWGGWFHDDSIQALFSRFSEYYKSKLYDKYTPAAEIAVFIDENAHGFFADRSTLELVHESRRGLGLSGVPYDIYLQSDADKFDAKRYKCLVFLCAQNPSARERAAIGALRARGVSMIFMWGADIFSGANITDMPRTTDAQADPPWTPAASAERLFDGVYARDNVVCTTVKQLTPTVWQALFRRAGAHVYAPPGNIVYAGGGLVTLCSPSGGKTTLSLPCSSEMREIITGEEYSGKELVLDLQKGETLLIECGVRPQ